MPDTPTPEHFARVQLLLLDVDGVLTDGRIVYTDAGQEVKAFHVRDGSGLKFWRRSGRRVAILSGRSSPAVARRAAELGIDPVVQGADEKLPALRRILSAARPHRRVDSIARIAGSCAGDDRCGGPC